MTALARARRSPTSAALEAWAPIGLVLGGLGVIVGGRAVALRAGVDGLAGGAVFGLALIGLVVLARAVARGERGENGEPGERAGEPAPLRELPREYLRFAGGAGLGLLFGLGLVAIAVIGPALAGAGTVPGLGRQAAPFAAWAVITILVATAEEVLLRGAFLDRIGRVAGIVPAILLTSAVFALMHVPLYGWHVVPLDFAVGLGLAGLRLSTRSLVAPVAAHALADLATWWL